jgi:hypothetical protein
MQAWRNHSSQSKLSAVLARMDQNTLKPPQVNNYLPAPQVLVQQAATPLATVTALKGISYRQVALPPGLGLQQSAVQGKANPGVEIVVTANEDISYPAFQAECDRPCSFDFGIAVNDSTKFNRLDSPKPTIARVEFVIPALLAKGKQLAIDYRSADDKPIRVTLFRLYAANGVKKGRPNRTKNRSTK